MKIEADPKEIAALVSLLQERPFNDISFDKILQQSNKKAYI